MKKKILCFTIALSLIASSSSVAFAKQGHSNGGNKHQQNEQYSEQQDTNQQATVDEVSDSQSDNNNHNKQSFKINGSSVIKYGKYILPIRPITKGMGATVDFNNKTGVLTVTKDSIVIVINFIDKTVTVNGVPDTTSKIFTVKNNRKSTVLIKYIAEKLGVRVTTGKDDITVEVAGLNAPTAVSVSPVGVTIVSNTLNTSTQYMIASANITAGQATGGKAELYVGSKLVATDAEILATDTIVSFSTSDGTPTNEELKVAVPQSGDVTVKLYNVSGQFVTSKSNLKLVADYTVPTITSISSAALSISGGTLTLMVSGAGQVNDKVDVSKISLYDAALNKTYALINTTV